MVIWVQRFEETGSVAAKPSGGSISPLEQHAEFLLGLIANQPDLTLDEIVAAMRKRRIAGSRSAVWRFFARRNISCKKNSVRGRAEACGRRLMREAQVNLAIRWFAGYALHEKLLDHSSLTRIRQRWGPERFKAVLSRTVKACMAARVDIGADWCGVEMVERVFGL